VSEALYDKAAVKRRLRWLFQNYGRGAGSRLAEAVGVSPTSANRWASPRGDCPDPSHWPAIEDFFGVDRGDLAKAGGLVTTPADTDVVGIAALAGELSPEDRAKVEGYIRGLLDGKQERKSR
jgi:hypothetical protein